MASTFVLIVIIKIGVLASITALVLIMTTKIVIFGFRKHFGYSDLDYRNLDFGQSCLDFKNCLGL